MNWSLRSRTQKEIDEEISLRRRYRNYDKEVCPLEVVFADGTKCAVWDLSEQKIFGLIKTMSETMENSQRDMLREQWAGQIVRCWMDKHPHISAVFASKLFELSLEKNGPAKELIRDLSGNMLDTRKNMAIEVAKYQANGGKISDNDILEVLKNEAKIEQNQQMDK